MSEKNKFSRALGIDLFENPRTAVFTLAFTAMMTALYFVINRFMSVYLLDNSLKIGFSFIPVVAAAVVCGPVSGALVGGLGDLLGSILVPNGAPMPLLTVSAALCGAVFGLMLYRKSPAFKSTLWRTAVAVLINQGFFSLVWNTFSLALLFSPDNMMGYFVLKIPARAVQAVGMAVAQLILVPAVCTVCKRVKKPAE